MSTPTTDHYHEAERLVALAEEHWMEPEGGDYEPTDDPEELETRNEIRESARADAMTWLAMAQVHATLATAAPNPTATAGFEPVDPTAMRIGLLEEELSATRMQRDQAVELERLRPVVDAARELVAATERGAGDLVDPAIDKVIDAVDALDADTPGGGPDV